MVMRVFFTDHGDEWCAREPSKDVIFCFDKHSGYVVFIWTCSVQRMLIIYSIYSYCTHDVLDTVATVVQDGATVYGISCSLPQILLVGLKRGSCLRTDRRGQELHWMKTMVDDLRLRDPRLLYTHFTYGSQHSFTHVYTFLDGGSSHKSAIEIPCDHGY